MSSLVPELTHFADGSPVPRAPHWEGEDINTLPREKLIEIIGELGREMESMYRSHRSALDAMGAIQRRPGA